MPATAPIRIASIGVTYPAAGVIVPRPATAPVTIPRELGLPLIQLTAIQESAPAAAAVLVTTIAFTAIPFAARALPPLNPNHPNQRRPAPSRVMGILCGSMVYWPYP